MGVEWLKENILCVSSNAQSTCMLCLNVCIHGNTWACSCIHGQCVFLWHSDFGGPLPTRTSAPLPLTATPPRGRWAEHSVVFGAGLVGTSCVCGIHSSFPWPAPDLSAMACWHSNPREALGTAERLAWVFEYAHTCCGSYP